MNNQIKAQIKKWTVWSDWKAMIISSESGMSIEKIKFIYLATH